MWIYGMVVDIPGYGEWCQFVRWQENVPKENP
jgi:hypothetical protein